MTKKYWLVPSTILFIGLVTALLVLWSYNIGLAECTGETDGLFKVVAEPLNANETIYRFRDPDTGVTCYIFQGGGLSCLQVAP